MKCLYVNCNVSQNTPKSYLRHLSEDHGNNEIICPICNDIRISRHALYKHIESVHNDEYGKTWLFFLKRNKYRIKDKKHVIKYRNLVYILFKQ